MKTGFTSTSLRKYSAEEVVRAAKESGACAIEWGTDFHIKNEEDALLAKRLCDENGIKIRSLGTYYRIGSGDFGEWERLCRLAGITGAEYMRTWLGTKGSASVKEEEYAEIVSESLKLCETAERYGAVISNECHPGTYNDTTDSALRYIRDTGGRIKTYYQSWYRDRTGDFQKLEKLLPYVSDVHVSFSELKKFQTFHKKDALFIPDMVSELKRRGFGGYVFIEFTARDKYENLVEDVKKLASLVSSDRQED